MSKVTGAVDETDAVCPACGEGLIVITKKDWDELMAELEAKPAWKAESIPEKPTWGGYGRGRGGR